MATVWAAGAIAALLVVAGLLFSLGSVVMTRHRAADAADLAALAAAGLVDRGGEVACERARSVAEKMMVRLKSCRLEHWDALVEVEASAPGGLGVTSARARAGPVARRAVGAGQPSDDRFRGRTVAHARRAVGGERAGPAVETSKPVVSQGKTVL